MNQIAFICINMFAPLLLGLFVSRLFPSLTKFFDRLMLLNLMLLTPVITLLAFWGFTFQVDNIALPVLGLLMQLLPGIFVWVFLLKKEMSQSAKGSLIIASFFGARTTVGCLSVYVLFGEHGYSLARLAMLFGPMAYYLIGFSVANYYAHNEQLRPHIRTLLWDPKMLPVLGIIVGALLNFYGPSRPEVVGDYFSILIAINTWLFMVPVGLSLQFRGLGDAWKQSGWLVPFRMLLLPATMFFLCWLFAVSGEAMWVVIVLAFSPVASGAVLVARLYGIDAKLVMASYLETTIAYLLLVIPFLLLIFN